MSMRFVQPTFGRRDSVETQWAAPETDGPPSGLGGWCSLRLARGDQRQLNRRGEKHWCAMISRRGHVPRTGLIAGPLLGTLVRDVVPGIFAGADSLCGLVRA